MILILKLVKILKKVEENYKLTKQKINYKNFLPEETTRYFIIKQKIPSSQQTEPSKLRKTSDIKNFNSTKVKMTIHV